MTARRRPTSVANILRVIVRGCCIVGLAAAVVSPISCTTGDPGERYVRDGEQYGVTEGRFRGRWWNYYERGASFLQGGFYAEAEADFRAALAGRSRDQRWARTYGLHLVPAYFPHRELGIALFRQGQAEEAIERFDASLGMAWSARAAYYRDLARRELLADSGRDQAAPVIDVTAPASDVALASVAINVRGVVRDDTWVSAVQVGDRPVLIQEAAAEVLFDEVVVLRPGENSIEISATDLAGKTSTQRVSLQADHDGPFVSFDALAVGANLVTGKVWDGAGIASFRVGGRDAQLVSADDDWKLFSVALEHSLTEEGIAYIAADEIGNETRGTVGPESATAAMTGDIVFAADYAHIFAGNAQPSHETFAGYVFASATTGPRVQIENIPEEARIVGVEELQVQVAVESPSPLRAISIGSDAVEPQPVQIPGNVTHFRFSRRLPVGEATRALVAQATNEDGQEGEDVVPIEWEPPVTELPDQRARAALFAKDAAIPSGLEKGLPERVSGRLERSLADEHKRFTFVARDVLDQILIEQEIAQTLASAEGAIQLGQLANAELLLAFRAVLVESDNMELSAEVISAETSTKLAYADVAGPVSEADRLASDLAALIVQAYPRAQGVAQMTSGEEGIATLSRRDNVRADMRCVLFREGAPILNPIDGSVMGVDAEIVGPARLTAVQEQFSKFRRVPAADAQLEPIGESAGGEALYVFIK